MSVTPLQQALSRLAERDEMGGFPTVAAELFPGWQPKRCSRAPHREEKNPSFSLYRNPQNEWRFKDFGTGEQGGLVGFVMLAGMDKKQAAHWIMERAGIRPGRTATRAAKTARVEPPPSPKPRPDWPPEVSDAWSEGVDYLQGHPDCIEALAQERAWPVSWVKRLATCELISMPLYHGRRAIAFPVDAPEAEAGGMALRRIGYHCRLHPRTGEQRASWRFVPNAAEHGLGTPALPYILGGASFSTARLLVITGGQWDALTFALAAGWLDRPWPEGVCVIGIRGDASTEVFLRHYEPFWPPDVRCLLFPDGDASGDRWVQTADSFASRLMDYGCRISIAKCCPYKDLNDLHRVSPITREKIEAILAPLNIGMETEVAS